MASSKGAFNMEFLTLPQAGNFLGIPVSTLRRAAKRGGLILRY